MAQHSASLIGRRIGAYRIVSFLGAGGMGEVYRARDDKLRRDVAIKVLPSSFTSDPDRLARFEREARTLAALNHPFIAAIYGYEEATASAARSGARRRTDACRTHRGGPASVNEALTIGHQIAEAIEAAHEKGIIHRDLKPANIKLARMDASKCLISVSRRRSTTNRPSPIDHKPPRCLPARQTRRDPGTAAYMSPEQTRGRPVDKRTDIWAFGCVLYEILSGRMAVWRRARCPTSLLESSNANRSGTRCRKRRRCVFDSFWVAAWKRIIGTACGISATHVSS